MPNSYAEKAQFTCPTTGKPFDFEVWLIVDTTERPDLVAKIREGKLYEVVSPYTNEVIRQGDAPLLIFQPDKQPVLMFSPMDGTTPEQTQQQAIGLIGMLRQELGISWQDSWVERGVAGISRALLPIAIDDFPRAIQLLEQSQNQNDTSDELDAILEELRQPPRNIRDIPRRVELCQRALAILPKTGNEQLWAMLQVGLGNSLAQTPAGNRAYNIEQAILAYQQALTVRTQSAMPVEWAQTLNNLAIAYSDRIRGDKAENIEEAILLYTQALTVMTQSAMPVEWATTMNNLANTYANRIRGYKAENIEEAIQHYTQALTVTTQSAMPVEWAQTMNNLANAYSDRIRGDKAENIEEAILLYTQALTLRTQFAMPVEWANTMNNLANAYSDRIRGDKAENIEEAIRHYTQALTVRTQSAMPVEWANTMNNLANAYSDRIRGDKAENIEEAILLYTQALTLRTQFAMPVEWANTMNNLANAYSDRIRGDKAENIEEAIRHYTQALTVRTQSAMPVEWANTMNNLANAYSDRIRGDKAENIEEAIRHYTQALTVMTQSAMPVEWATTMNNLATAYYSRIRGDKAENIEEAIRHYTQALTVRTQSAMPRDHQGILRNLNSLYFENKRWGDVVTTSGQIIDVGKDIFASAYTDAGRQSALSDSGLAYTQLAYALVQLGQYDEALLALDAGKARLLAEALSFGDANLAELTLQEREKIQHYRDAITSLEYEYRLPPNHPSRRDERLIADTLRDVRGALRNYMDSLRTCYPNLMPEGIPLADLLALIPEKTVLVAPVFTTQGSAVFIIPHGTTAISQQHILMLDGVTTDTLYQMTIGTPENKGWLRRYVTRNHPDLFNAIDEIGQLLWDTLIGQVHEQVQALGEMAQVIIMPQGNLGLLPVHVAWRMVEGQKRYWLDDYVITYATSGYSLASAKKRDVTGRDALIVGVGEYPRPISNLPNTVAEANAIASLFNTPSITNANATVDKVKAEAHRANYLHLSCHGTFAWGGDIFNAGLLLHNAEMLNLAHIMTQLKLTGTRLVTLSACETGITDFNQASDEFLGLPAGFMQAGAMGVVSSLWTVEDRSTALLMGQFYRKHINEGMHPAIALREAQDWIRNATTREIGDYYLSFLRMSKEDAQKGAVELVKKNLNPDDKPYAHPFYWSAFIYTGI